MMAKNDSILLMVINHSESIRQAVGDDKPSLYMEGYLKACSNIADLIYTYNRALEGDNNGKK